MGEKLHWMLVGNLTNQAHEEIQKIGVANPSDVLWVIGLPYPAFELQDNYEVRIKAGGKSFIWSGSHPGPEWNNAAETNLRSEHDQPVAIHNTESENLGDLDEITF